MKNRSAIFFAPHASIWVHAFPESLIAESLINSGYKVTMVGCRGVLSKRCVTFDCKSIRGNITSNERKSTCNNCINTQELINNKFKFTRLYLDDFITSSDITAIEQYISEANISDLINFKCSGIPIGRLATYELCLTFKKLSHDFSDIESVEYLDYLRGCYISLRAFEKIFSKLQPRLLFTYNSLYSANRTVSLLAKSMGIQPYSLHGGTNVPKRYTTLMLARDNQFEHLQHLISLWPKFSNIPCAEDVAISVTDHQLTILQGTDPWAFSAPVKSGANLHQYFGIPDGCKILLATMSSYDERFAAESAGVYSRPPDLLFPDQIDWIKWLFEYVAKRDDLFLIVRVHPREFPQKRPFLSEHAQLLRTEFETKPRNVAINWPDQNISLYDLALESDVVLNAWSSVGKELSMLGIPVVIYSSKLVGYPSRLNFLGESDFAYSQAIEQALSSGWNFERVRQTYRWLALELVYSVIDISESVSAPGKSQGLTYRLIRKFQQIMGLYKPYKRLELDCKKRSPILSQAHKIKRLCEHTYQSIADVTEIFNTIKEEDEEVYLKHQLYRLYQALKLEERTPTTLINSVNKFLHQKNDK